MKEVLDPESAVKGADIIATSEHGKGNKPITLAVWVFIPLFTY